MSQKLQVILVGFCDFNESIKRNAANEGAFC